MPRVTIQQNNFTGGEISPRVHGRTDVDRYGSSAAEMVNAHPLVHGGFKSRAGTMFAAPAKFSDRVSRLIPFVVSQDVSYMLEFGDGYVRVFNARGAAIVEIQSPYSYTMVQSIDFCQAGSIMYLFHDGVRPHRIQRVSNTVWVMGPVPFLETPFAEIGRPVSAQLTLSDNRIGPGRWVSSATDVFYATDIGRTVIGEGGQATIVGYQTPRMVDITVDVPFPRGFIQPATIGGSPMVTCTPSATGPIGAEINLTLSQGAAFPDDPGKYVRINGGLCKIISVTSGTVWRATVIRELSSTTAAPKMAWSLEDPVWTPSNGFPRTGTMHEQRLIMAGTKAYPRTIWGSVTGEHLNFSLGTDDTDAFAFTIDSDEANDIAFVSSARTLVVNTYGGEFSVQGGVEKPITPTNVRIRQESSYGCKGVRPALVGKESMFVQRAGRKVRSMGYRYDFDGYASPDIAVLAEHITAPGVTELAYEAEPDCTLWAVRSDGALLSCTIDREQSVLGWAKHYTEGAFESVATRPVGDRTETWVIVRRTVGGQTKRYLEVFDPTYEPLNYSALSAWPPYADRMVYGCTVDCGITFEPFVPTNYFSGLGHLEGMTVDIVADGRPMPPQVVSGGVVMIDRDASRVLIGLHFKSWVTLLTPEVGTGTGTAQGNSMRTGELTLRFLDSLGCQVVDDEGNVQDLPFRHLGDEDLDAPPALFSGLVRIEKLGWARGSNSLQIVQDNPLPMHVLAAIRKFTVND